MAVKFLGGKDIFENPRKWWNLFFGKRPELPSIEEQRKLFSQPTPTPTPTPIPLKNIIEKGLTDWGRGTAPPIATMSAQLAEAGKDLPHQFLPAALSLKETGGLRDSARARLLNNPFGIGPGIQYENLGQAILGGVDAVGRQRKGLKGVLEGEKYKKYRESGDLRDFLEVYTPTSDTRNASIERQLAVLQQLLDYFK